ncbi:MAG: glycoside hydrolase domain-containing protein [Victivallales bacterium]
MKNFLILIFGCCGFRIGISMYLLSLASGAAAVDRSSWPANWTETDVAFWKPYEIEANTYVLIHFDDTGLVAAEGKVSGAGKTFGDARYIGGGKFSGAAHFDGVSFLRFPTEPLNVLKMSISSVVRSLSVEAWIKMERYPAAGGKSMIVCRPDNKGTAIGLSLFVDSEGALGMGIKGGKNPGVFFKSEPGKVPLNEWVHVAGISCGGHQSPFDTLYVNGVEVYCGSNSGAGGEQPETESANLFVGADQDGKDGFTGLIDELRIHCRIQRFWPLDPMPWIGRIVKEGLPPLDEVLERCSQPTLTFSLDGDTKPSAHSEVQLRDPAIAERYRDMYKVDFKGDFVPGVRGLAANGALKISGPLGDWKTQGAIELWVRPRGMNNLSDQGIGLFSGSGLTANLFNAPVPFKAFTIYYRDQGKKLRMHSDQLKTEFHPGRWYHIVLTWDPETIFLFINGKLSTSGENLLKNSVDSKNGLLSEIILNDGSRKGRPFGDVDELCLYERRLSADEADNRYWSYVDPGKIKKAALSAPVFLSAWRLPSQNAIYYRLSRPGVKELDKVTLELADGNGKEILRVDRDFNEKLEKLETPKLADGAYTLSVVVNIDGKELKSEPWTFESKQFPWQANDLGISNEIFPPFEAIQVDGNTASVVLRKYRMNGFGLWDSVLSQGRELLAAPVRLCYETESGKEGSWEFAEGKFVLSEPHLAKYKAKVTSDEVIVETVSEIEMDGMMKVTMTLMPGVKPVEITRMWLEIPVVASEASLMHEDTGSLRRNYSGKIPEGKGAVWKSDRKADRDWRNAFTGYVWVGGVERGIAWFAENDKGWITEKKMSDRPLQEIVRNGKSVTIRVNLINIPAIVKDKREIVFGLQSSPTKPVPADCKTGERGGGLSVIPWGGLECADKFPFEDRWEVVDKIIESQTTGKDNLNWFQDFKKEHDIPPLFGTGDWVKSVSYFASRPKRPILTYFEEMAAPTYRKEWHVYKDEWSRDVLSPRRAWPKDTGIFRQGKGGEVNAAYRVNFTDSYRDYGSYYANEWLKRGVGIYWDNTFLTTASNPLTSNAYLCEDGNIQPALTLWSQREYSRRIWNLLHQWERKRGEKLLFLQHMTNTNLLPILSWCTTSFDMEWSARRYSGIFPKIQNQNEPFSPDFLQAQSMGRQVGNYPALCFGLFQFKDFALDPKLMPEKEMDTPDKPEDSIYSAKREWGMSRVHEIPHFQVWRHAAAKLEKAFQGFGYGSPDVSIHNYWADRPALKTDRDDVKWLLLARPEDKRLLLILQSWSRTPVPVKISFDFGVIGFRPGGIIVNMETGGIIAPDKDGGGEISLDTPYDFKMIGIGGEPLHGGVLFADDFANGLSPRWTSVRWAEVANRADGGRTLRLAGKRGGELIEMWNGVENWLNTELRVDFRLSAVPEKTMSLFTVKTRSETPQWHPVHGMDNTALIAGQQMDVRAYDTPGSNVLRLELLRSVTAAQGKRLATVPLGKLDTRPHALSIVMEGRHTRVLFDGEEVAAFNDTPELGGAFGVYGGRNLSETLYVDVDKIAVTEINSDKSILKK